MDGWNQCLFPSRKPAGSKPNLLRSFTLDLIALGAFLRLSTKVHPLDSIYWKKRPRRFWLSSECLAWPLGRWPQRQAQWGGIEKKKKKKGGPTSIASLSSNEKSNERKGKKKKKRGELISDGIEAIITRLASVLALLILMSSLIRFNLTAPNWSTGIFSFSYFLYLSPPPSHHIWGDTHRFLR